MRRVPHILEVARVLMRSHSVTICDCWAKTFQRTVSSLPTSKMTLGNVNFREIPTHYDDDDVGVDDDGHDDVDDDVDVDGDDLGQHQLPGKSAPPAHTRTHTVDQLFRVCITLQLCMTTSSGAGLYILPGGCVTWRGRFQEVLAIAGRHFPRP